ncbi:hypothetical protein SARC_17474, partial [Sphaeroforma arctica JP610]
MPIATSCPSAARVEYRTSSPVVSAATGESKRPTTWATNWSLIATTGLPVIRLRNSMNNRMH